MAQDIDDITNIASNHGKRFNVLQNIIFEVIVLCTLPLYLFYRELTDTLHFYDVLFDMMYQGVFVNFGFTHYRDPIIMYVTLFIMTACYYPFGKWFIIAHFRYAPHKRDKHYKKQFKRILRVSKSKIFLRTPKDIKILVIFCLGLSITWIAYHFTLHQFLEAAWHLYQPLLEDMGKKEFYKAYDVGSTRWGPTGPFMNSFFIVGVFYYLAFRCNYLTAFTTVGYHEYMAFNQYAITLSKEELEEKIEILDMRIKEAKYQKQQQKASGV